MQSATFPTEQLQSDLRRTTTNFTISRTGVVVYEDKTIKIMEEGKILHLSKGIEVFRVYNRIEGDLFFAGNARPKERVFPGFGKLLPTSQ